MIEYVGWGLLAVSLWWIYVFRRTVGNARFHMFCYLTMVLADEAVREQQFARFQEWVKGNSNEGERLIWKAVSATQDLADKMAVGTASDSSINIAISVVLSAQEKANPSTQ